MTDVVPAVAVACPACGARGKLVQAVTLESLLTPEALSSIENRDGWRHCSSADCSTAYFHSGGHDRLDKADVVVRIGTKETAAPRLLCYCFGHTAEAIEDEVARSGASTIPAAIGEQCRQGLDRCALTNPQGSCCLGNVRAVVQLALRRGPAPTTAAVEDCCASKVERGGDAAGALASIGAMGAAILSSACCWLPLLLLAFGVSTGGAAGFLKDNRTGLLSITAVLLALAFWLSYRRVVSSRLMRLNRAMVWIATVVVVLFAAFPGHVGRWIRSGDEKSTSASADCCAQEHRDSSGRE